MPGLPISKKQLDKLGDRLRDAGSPAAEDFEMLEAVLGAYDEALQEVRETLRELGFEPTVRLKTTGTIVDKLRRERSSSLKTIHDLAGARIVLSGSLRAQDAAVRLISEAYSDAPVPPLVIDRRSDPRAGYRAVHMILKIGGIPVEVQLRTELQDRWAQLFERLADVWGRQIRYGGAPSGDSADRAARRQDIVDLMMKISGLMEEHEARGAKIEGWGIPALLRNAGVGFATVEEDVPVEFRGVRSTYLELKADEARLDKRLRVLLTMVADMLEREVNPR
ncbi:RelA/SpoT domain-containing protein [Nucisporomicrobium flavum]|uniref:RelA/SpoT domain-containing protein n=1 Tax=Nucisporomicrobium flavum TaxID=2785915 RepID=UPI0018F620BA|nr:RelA/SpoT domain-containing protein [Nucisporomicrobium flavum]